MCGIIGFTGFDDELAAKRMNASIAHRGPDQDGFYFDSNISLGNRRLKIIDLSEAGRQPMHNEDKTVWVTFNGEIYNYKQLRSELETKGHRFYSKSDTEVLAHGFEEWGDALPARLRGDFAFAIWDSKKKKLFLARDNIGVNPLYYSFYETGGRNQIAFASEIKALLLHPLVKRETDLQALNEYLSLRYPLGPRTLFAGIQKLQPGTFLEFNAANGEARVGKYWNFSFAPARETEAFFVDKIRALLGESVKMRLMSDVPLGAYLSGGLDSSFIVALMARAARESGAASDSVKTFSVSFGQPTDETRFARLVAEEYSTNHKELSIDVSNAVQSIPLVAWHLDEPVADAAAIPTFFMARAVKPNATVVLTGDGGDEVFGGYARYHRLPRLHKRAWIARKARHFAFLARLLTTREASKRLRETLANARDRVELFLAYASAFSEDEKKEFLKQNVWEELKEFPSVVDEIKPFFEGKANYADELFNFDLKTLLPDDYLMKVNKMSMAHSVESRVPYLDSEFISFAATIPHDLKIEGSRTKKIMRKAMNGFVPREVIERGKWGFNVPTRAWLGGELGEIAAQLLSDEAVRKRGLFENRLVQSVLRNYSKNEAYYSRQFWSLFALELWHRVFIDPPEETALRAPKSFNELL
ncbi:asparagine synthase (glutamine-hydrolyzing) [Candidatus Micrarchaeota archaeon]|nr:asparagine synthase (glutamine-hydrolyzing) [Candidatus Micrarchaeota archaeon]